MNVLEDPFFRFIEHGYSFGIEEKYLITFPANFIQKGIFKLASINNFY